MKLDILAIGAHPDDVELSCSGTLILHKKKGYATGILDLTEGELGSRGTKESRQEESARANYILNLDMRMNLGYRDGFFTHDEAHILPIISVLRRFQPDIVLATAPYDRHPDHGRSSALIKDACFLSGLVKIKTTHEGQDQEPWRPKRLFNYIQDQEIEPDFIIDISEVMEEKMASILAYNTQFNSEPNDGIGPATYISSKSFMTRQRCRNSLLGKRIGTDYGEGFLSINSNLGLSDFSSIILPDVV
jgi:bacillithiol biosynthesis deacetylase BshB1